MFLVWLLIIIILQVMTFKSAKFTRPIMEAIPNLYYEKEKIIMKDKVMGEVLNAKVDKDVVETGLEVVRDKNCKGKLGLIILGVASIAAAGVVVYRKVIKPRKQIDETPIAGDATACTEDEDEDIIVDVVNNSEDE